MPAPGVALDARGAVRALVLVPADAGNAGTAVGEVELLDGLGGVDLTRPAVACPAGLTVTVLEGSPGH